MIATYTAEVTVVFNVFLDIVRVSPKIQLYAILTISATRSIDVPCHRELLCPFQPSNMILIDH